MFGVDMKYLSSTIKSGCVNQRIIDVSKCSYGQQQLPADISVADSDSPSPTYSQIHSQQRGVLLFVGKMPQPLLSSGSRI